MDPGLPVPLVEPLDDRVAASVAEPTFYASLLSLFAWIALALAAIGVYGTMAYVARQRTTELGIRLALGAPSHGLRRLLVWQELRWVGIGLAAGTAAALASARALGGFLYGVAPSDPVTLAGSILVLGGVAAFACWLPARRATRLDPMTVLRD
jgi:ABC-type antimicrobial peptide transport system permease subunit